MAKRAKPTAGETRIPLMVRTAPALRERLEAAAAESGRSLAQEAELRLERSFELVEIIEKSINGTASIFKEVIADQSQMIENHMLNMAGGDSLFNIWFYLAYVIKGVEAKTGKTIREDNYTKHLAETELLGAIPGIFRNLPKPYSEAREDAKKPLKGAPPGSLLSYGEGELPDFLKDSLPPLGWTGPWPPKKD